MSESLGNCAGGGRSASSSQIDIDHPLWIGGLGGGGGLLRVEDEGSSLKNVIGGTFVRCSMWER